MIPRRYAILLLLLACVALWIVGYRAGSQDQAPGAANTPGNPGSAGTRRERDEAPPGIDAAERLKELLHAPQDSRTALNQSWNIICGLSANEIEDAVGWIVQNPREPSAMAHIAMLYFRWAQLDPEAALASAQHLPPELSSPLVIDSALTAWMSRDPEAAFRHAEASPEIPDKGSHRKMMAQLLINEGLSALEKASSYGNEVRKMTIQALAVTANDSDEARQAFLDEVARQGSETEQTEARQALIQQWAALDPRVAMESLEQIGAPEEEHPKHRESIFQRWVREDPAAALSWSAEHPGDLPLAERAESYSRWAARLPGQALETLPLLEREPGFLEATVKRLQAAYNREGWTPYGSDPQRHAGNRAALLSHFTRWSEQSPAEARLWLESLPTDLRLNLTHPVDENP